MENQPNADNKNAQQIGQNPVNQNMLNTEKIKINYLAIGITVLVSFIVFGIGGYYLGLNNQKNKQKDNTQPTTSIVSPITPTISEQGSYVATELSSSFKLPDNWTEELYTKSLEPSKRGFAIYDNCNLEYCVFFENKKYIDKSNMQAYSTPTEDGRVYGYLFVASSEKLLGEKWKSVSETIFFSAIGERFPERAKATSSEECGPYYAKEKTKEITTLRYKTVLSTSYPACNYESGRPEDIHEAYYLLLNSKDILVVRFFYNKTSPNVAEEINNFKELLSSISLKAK